MTSYVLLSPFSNDPLRDWPLGYYRDLVELFLGLGEKVCLLGADSQRQSLNVVCRDFSATYVQVICGVSWRSALKIISEARLVVGNNSGVSHAAASLGVPTLCIFSGTHSLAEWSPRGPLVSVLRRDISCSPCAGSGHRSCSNGFACMVGISPEVVFKSAKALLLR